MVGGFGWQITTIAFGVMMFCVIPLTRMVASAPLDNSLTASGQRQQSFGEALKEAFSHRSYNLLVIGFFTCGFQLAFVTVHFQSTSSARSPRAGSATRCPRTTSCPSSTCRARW